MAHTARATVIAIFILMLLLPPLYRNVHQATIGGDETWIPALELFKKSGDENIIEHLKSFENDLEE